MCVRACVFICTYEYVLTFCSHALCVCVDLILRVCVYVYMCSCFLVYFCVSV